jgi:X-linked retinitis pigmentosa GTPase regulator
MISRQKKKNNISHIDFSGSYSKKPVETYPKDRAESVNYNNDNKVDGGVPMDKITMDSLDDGIKGKINEIKELKDENVKLKDEIEKMKPFIDYVSKLKEREKNEKIEKIVDLRITLGLLDNANKDKYVEKISKWDDERLDETMNDLVALAEKTIKEEKEEINSNKKDENEDSEVTEKEVVDEETEDPKEDSTEDSEEVNSEESEDNDDNEDVNSNGEDGIKKLDKTEGIENKDEQEIVVKTK